MILARGSETQGGHENSVDFVSENLKHAPFSCSISTADDENSMDTDSNTFPEACESLKSLRNTHHAPSQPSSLANNQTPEEPSPAQHDSRPISLCQDEYCSNSNIQKEESEEERSEWLVKWV